MAFVGRFVGYAYISMVLRMAIRLLCGLLWVNYWFLTDTHAVISNETSHFHNDIIKVEDTSKIEPFMNLLFPKHYDMKDIFVLSKGGRFINKTKTTFLKFTIPKDITTSNLVTSVSLNIRSTANNSIGALYLTGRKTNTVAKIVKKDFPKLAGKYLRSMVGTREAQWVTIDLTKRLKRILMRRRKLKRKHFNVEVLDENERDSILQQHGSYLKFKVLSNNIKKRIRKRREERKSNNCVPKTTCCLQTAWVDFKRDLQLEPIYPPFYKLVGGAQFHYCGGGCDENGGHFESERCCIATKFRKISVIVKKKGANQQSGEVKHLEIDATECSCR